MNPSSTGYLISRSKPKYLSSLAAIVRVPLVHKSISGLNLSHILFELGQVVPVNLDAESRSVG